MSSDLDLISYARKHAILLPKNPVLHDKVFRQAMNFRRRWNRDDAVRVTVNLNNLKQELERRRASTANDVAKASCRIVRALNVLGRTITANISLVASADNQVRKILRGSPGCVRQRQPPAFGIRVGAPLDPCIDRESISPNGQFAIPEIRNQAYMRAPAHPRLRVTSWNMDKLDECIRTLVTHKIPAILDHAAKATEHDQSLTNLRS